MRNAGWPSSDGGTGAPPEEMPSTVSGSYPANKMLAAVSTSPSQDRSAVMTTTLSNPMFISSATLSGVMAVSDGRGGGGDLGRRRPLGGDDPA